jgi:hypothetical protein
VVDNHTRKEKFAVLRVDQAGRLCVILRNCHVCEEPRIRLFATSLFALSPRLGVTLLAAARCRRLHPILPVSAALFIPPPPAARGLGPVSHLILPWRLVRHLGLGLPPPFPFATSSSSPSPLDLHAFAAAPSPPHLSTLLLARPRRFGWCLAFADCVRSRSDSGQSLLLALAQDPTDTGGFHVRLEFM